MNKKGEFQEISKTFDAILADPMPWESGMVSLIALLKEKLSYVSWIGFYRLQDNQLWVGPYQGKLACIQIEVGKGVCGTAAKTKKSQLVPDVHAYPGHIACDSLSRSELVIPVEHLGKIVGVLDLDSYQLAAFDGTDQAEIEKLLKQLQKLKR